MPRLLSFLLAPATAFTALLLIASLAMAQPAAPLPANVNKQTIFNGGSRYIYYQAPPDAPPRIQALYRSLGQAENDQFLSDELQQLLLEYTEQERLLGWARTSSELIYGLPGGRLVPGGGYTSPDGITKAWTVMALVQAAQVRGQFGGDVNRQLEQLQEEERALKGKAGDRSRGEIIHRESLALRQQRAAWQNYQAACQYEKAASRLVQQATRMQQQAARGKRANTAVLTAWRNLAAGAHRVTQDSVQKAKSGLDAATAHLRAAQAESMLVMQVPSAASGAAAPEALQYPRPASAVWPSPSAGRDKAEAAHAREVQWNLNSTQQNSERAEQMAALAGKWGSLQERAAWLKERDAFLKEHDAWQKESLATPTERSAAVAARREAQRERVSAQHERTALQQTAAAARRAQADRAVVDPVRPIMSQVVLRPLTVNPPPARLLPQPAADQPAPVASWMVVSLAGLVVLLLLALGLPTLLLYRRLARLAGAMAAVSPQMLAALQAPRGGPEASSPSSDAGS